MKLWHKVTLGLILGLFFGVYLPQYAAHIKPVGTIFLRLITMVIIPLIFFSVVSGITSMNDPSSLGRVGMKSVFAYVLTTLFAVMFGLLVAYILEPGKGVVIDFGGSKERNFNNGGFDVVDFFVEIVPGNIFQSFAEAKLLQVVFFSIFTGIIINSMGSAAVPLKNLIDSAAKLVLQMISKIVKLSPYAAFALTAWVVGDQGIEVMLSLSKLVMAVLVAMTLQYFVFGLMILIFCRLSPIPFYKKSIEYQMIALSTGSSKASLGTTMQVCRERLGVSESSTSFVLPLGASINMDGFAINLSLTAVFFAQMMGIELYFSDYLMIILTSTLGSMGGAGIPGASLIMLPMVLSSVNMPIEGVAMIAGIDRILDLIRTAINITGDAAVTMVIDVSEGNLDKDIYYKS